MGAGFRPQGILHGDDPGCRASRDKLLASALSSDAKSMPPRTLFHVHSTLNVGGPQVRFATLANKLGPRFKHILFAMDHGYASTKLLDAKAPCEIRDVPYVKGNTARNFMSFRRTLNAMKPDVLVTYNWGAIEWAVANFGRACPHIHIVDGFGPEEANRQLPRRVLFRRMALARNTTTVVPSRTLHDIATKIWRLKLDRVIYIPNGIEPGRFQAPRDEDLARQYGLSPETLAIGTVAALRPEKNLGRLIGAFATLAASNSALRLIIVGDGAERALLQECAAQLGVAGQVIFTGYLANPAPILGLFDIFALSSDTEQMPISVLEAMASSLPVAAVQVGDMRHIVADENKPYIVEPNTDSLGAALAALAADPALRAKIGQANRAHVQSVYDETDMINAYEKLFSS
jgi:glycosyltransferase involved in cell wall biosynthesis